MNKEETMLKKRLIDLSNQAFQRDIVTFSDFLNLNELNILHTTPKNEYAARYETFGGYDLSERQMVAFLPDALYYEYEYPLQAVEIRPVNHKFAEKLTHRDYLGALMNLGLERSKFGDVLVEDDRAVVFVCEEISGFVVENLTQVRHTVVTGSLREISEISYAPKFQELKGTVASVRLDTVLSVAYPMSRSKLTAYIEGGKVFVNGKLITSNGYRLKPGDIISVRGMGRVQYGDILSETKKGRCFVTVKKYIS